jgi:hypothetical protein
MLVLSAIWSTLLVIEFTRGLSPFPHANVRGRWLAGYRVEPVVPDGADRRAGGQSIATYFDRQLIGDIMSVATRLRLIFAPSPQLMHVVLQKLMRRVPFTLDPAYREMVKLLLPVAAALVTFLATHAFATASR